jgi:hypothetical protein
MICLDRRVVLHWNKRQEKVGEAFNGNQPDQLSGFIRLHWTARLTKWVSMKSNTPSSLQAATPSADFNYSHPAIAMAKTLVGISQINSLASSGFTEQHVPSSEPQWKATFPAVSKQQHCQPTSITNRPAIATDHRPVTSRSSNFA